MEEIKAPKKERKFLKAMGDVALTLFRELLLNVGKKLINKSGNKRQGLVLAFIIIASTFALAQYPTTGNKQRLGFQTTGDGLVYRGRAEDTVGIKSSGLNNAYFILDTVNNIQYNYIKTKGGWVFSNGDTIIINNNFTQPVDSLFFNVGVPTNNVDTAKMRWDSDLATVVLGLNDNVPNEIGFKNFWLVKNQTGSTITKGSIVYANGTVGASGRITVAKFIADGSIDAKYLLGITAHDLSNGEDGYVISFGKIRQVNTDTFAAGAILYPSSTVAGVWTDIEPIAPNIDMPIGFCINSSSNNGTIAIRVASGYKLSELHDVAITSPVDKASLYYSGGLWRDTTAAMLTSDTASLSNRINLKLNIADTASMLAPYFRDADTTSLNLTSRFATKLNISDTASMLTNYLRSGVAASTYLPLTGGTLTGGLTGTNAVFSGSMAIGFPFAYKPLEVFSNVNDFVSVGTNQMTQFQWAGIHFGYRQPNYDYRSSAIVFQRNEIPPFIDATGKIHLLNVSYANSGRSADLRDAKLTISNIGGYVGINDTSPEYQLDVNGTLNATGATTLGSTLAVSGNITEDGNNVLTNLDTASLSTRIDLKLNKTDTASMLTPYFRDADTTSLNLTSRFAAKLNISDTASMLTNYLRTGVAASTYLPLTGGILSGTLGINAANPLFTKLAVNGDIGLGVFGTPNTSFKIGSQRPDGLGFTNAPYINFKTDVSANGLITFSTIHSGVAGYQDAMVINYDGKVGIGTINPLSKLDVNGTLNATGATTLSAPLTVNSSAVFNEGSTDSDFRVESDGNANMVFVDASTDRVGIGTNAPSKTLDVNGELRIATVTATPTALLGKDGSNVVGVLGLGTGMSVGSGILSVQAAGASATGLVTSFGSQTFGGNKTFNGNVNISTGTLDVGSTGTFGGRVKTNWLERNYAYSTSSSFTVSVNTTWQDIYTNVLTTLTLPNPATYPGKELHIRQTGSGSLQSASSNIIPFQTPPTGSTSTSILLASTHEAVTLVSDGTNWIIMQRSEN